MGWMKRSGDRKYYCRKVREGRSTRTIYIGGGAVAELESRRESLRKFEKELARRVWNREKAMIERAWHAFLELDEICNLLRDATLLSEGFVRQGRHPWEESKRAKKVLDGNVPDPDRRNSEGSETTESYRTLAIEGLAIYEPRDLE